MPQAPFPRSIKNRASVPLLGLLALLVGSVACSGTEDPGSVGGSAGNAGTAGAGAFPGGASGSGTTGGSAGSTFGGTGGTFGGSGGASGGGAGGGGAGGISGGTAGAAGTGGSASMVEPTFATVKRVVGLSCFGAPCHDEPGNPLQMKPIDNLIATLTAHTTQDCGPALTPGNPANSAFLKLLKADCGMTARMPLGKCFDDGDPGCVPPEDIAAIEKWIQDGANP